MQAATATDMYNMMGAGVPKQRSASQAIVGPKRNPEEIKAKVIENINKQNELHMAKAAMSNQNFKNARVTSTKAVLMKNGQAVCLAFPNPNQKPVDPKMNKSSETTSYSS